MSKRTPIPATVARTAIVDIPPPDESIIGRYAVIYEAAEVGRRVHVDPFSVVYPTAVVGEGAHIGSHCVVFQEAVIGAEAHIGSHCTIGRGAVVGDGATLGDGASLDPGCELGAGAFLGPGARLLDRTRLPTGEPGRPARVGERTRVGGNAVVCGGITVGRDAVVSAGDCVEDDVPDGGVWMGGRLAAVDEGKEW
jgi:acetyltransferase-like isoleucine patch superfamily enzyme